MASQWFCKIDGRERGPLTSQALKSMADKGRIQPDDPVRQGADGSWVPASRVKGLFPSDQAASVQQVKVESSSGSDSVSDSQAVLKAKPLEEEAPPAAESQAPAKIPPKAKAAAPRVAKPLEEPPAVPAEKAASVQPVGIFPLTLFHILASALIKTYHLSIHVDISVGDPLQEELELGLEDFLPGRAVFEQMVNFLGDGCDIVLFKNDSAVFIKHMA